MQCGTCAATCPLSSQMDYTPRQLIHLLALGLEDRAVSSRAIWLCASCTTCTARCPRGLDITEMMYRLRGMALERGLGPRSGRAFFRSFLDSIKAHGRSFEPGILIRYSFRTNPLALLKQLGFGWAMFRRGKIGPLPHRVAGRAQVKSILTAPSQQEPSP